MLNSSPLENIRATIDSQYVMVNGRLFEAETMTEVGGKGRAAPKFYWQRHGGVASKVLEQLLGPTAVCHCPKGAHSFGSRVFHCAISPGKTAIACVYMHSRPSNTAETHLALVRAGGRRPRAWSGI